MRLGFGTSGTWKYFVAHAVTLLPMLLFSTWAVYGVTGMHLLERLSESPEYIQKLCEAGILVPPERLQKIDDAGRS